MSEAKTMNETSLMIKNAMILFVITLIAGVALGTINEITKDKIAYQKELSETRANQAVFADAASFEDEPVDDAAASQILSGSANYANVTVNSVKEAKDAGGTALGYVLNMTSVGYGGDIVFTVGITNDGVVNGISIIEISETPGLGMNAEKVLVPQFDANSDAYATKNADMALEVFKGDAPAENQIRAISGATITSRAITNGVNAAIEYYNSALKGGR